MKKKQLRRYASLRFDADLSDNASWLSSHKCSSHERNFTFTKKRNDNEEQNEIRVSLSDSNEQLSGKCSFDWNLVNC